MTAFYNAWFFSFLDLFVIYQQLCSLFLEHIISREFVMRIYREYSHIEQIQAISSITNQDFSGTLSFSQ